MKLPSTFVPNKDLDNKVEDFMLNSPNFPYYGNDYSYESVVYTLLAPEELESLGVIQEKFFSARLEFNYNQKRYQIVFEPRLKECRTSVHFIELGNNRDKKSFLGLIENFIAYRKKCWFGKNAEDEEEYIRRSLVITCNKTWYAVSNISSYYSPVAVANFAKKFEDNCIIRSITFRDATEEELEKLGLPEDKRIK